MIQSTNVYTPFNSDGTKSTAEGASTIIHDVNDDYYKFTMVFGGDNSFNEPWSGIDTQVDYVERINGAYQYNVTPSIQAYNRFTSDDFTITDAINVTGYALFNDTPFSSSSYDPETSNPQLKELNDIILEGGISNGYSLSNFNSNLESETLSIPNTWLNVTAREYINTNEPNEYTFEVEGNIPNYWSEFSFGVPPVRAYFFDVDVRNSDGNTEFKFSIYYQPSVNKDDSTTFTTSSASLRTITQVNTISSQEVQHM